MSAYTRARAMYSARIADLAARGFLNPAFSIFLAKNTMDWSDKAEVTHSGGLSHAHFFETMLQKAAEVDSWTTRPATGKLQRGERHDLKAALQL